MDDKIPVETFVAKHSKLELLEIDPENTERAHWSMADAVYYFSGVGGTSS